MGCFAFIEIIVLYYSWSRLNYCLLTSVIYFSLYNIAYFLFDILSKIQNNIDFNNANCYILSGLILYKIIVCIAVFRIYKLFRIWIIEED